MFEFLLAEGGEYDLMSAVAREDLGTVREFINDDASLCNSEWMNGCSPLHITYTSIEILRHCWKKVQS